MHKANHKKKANIKFNTIFIVSLAMFVLIPIFAGSIESIASEIINNESRTATFNDGNNPYDPDPYYGTKEYWDDKFGPHEGLYLPSTIKAGTVLDQPNYFIKGDIKVESTTPHTPGLIIQGEVNFYFEQQKIDGQIIEANLTVIGANGSFTSTGGIGSSPGILLTKGNSLYCFGRGSLNTKSGSISVGANNTQGKNAKDTKHDYDFGWPISPGFSGAGGNGTGGIASTIGTFGGNGGAGGSSIEADRVDIGSKAWDDWADGIKGNDGQKGESTENAGNLAISGAVQFNPTIGVINKLEEPTQSKPGKPILYDMSSIPAWPWEDPWIFGGASAGGGNGGYGFFGCFVGSGGAGAGGAGSGGYAGYDWTKKKGNRWVPGGGGGGAGASSSKSLGGGADTSKYSYGDDHAYDGQDFNPDSIWFEWYDYAQGGSGASADATGGKGGNGGPAGISGSGGLFYGSFEYYSQNNSNDNDSAYPMVDHNGRSNLFYGIYPQDECEIVFKNPISEDNNMFPYTGEPVIPEFDVVYKPTGAIIPTNAYEVNFSDNTDVGTATLNIKSNPYSFIHSVIGKSFKQGGGELTTNFQIVNSFLVQDFTIENEKTYDTHIAEYNLNFVKITTLEGEEIPEFTKEDLNLDYYKYSNKEWSKLDNAPKDVGKYKVTFFSENDPYNLWVCSSWYEFEINPKDVIAKKDDFRQGYVVSKVYDGNSSSKDCLSGGLVYDGIFKEDEQAISFEPIINDFKGPDAYTELNIPSNIVAVGDETIINNYVLTNPVTPITYQISKRVIKVKSINPINRMYIAGDYSVFAEIEFDNLFQGMKFYKDQDWVYTGETTDHSDAMGQHECYFTIALKDHIYKNCGLETETSYTQTYNGYSVTFGDTLVPRPTASTLSYVYNGEYQTYEIGGRENYYTVSNNVQKIPGTYEVVYKLVNGVAWADVPESEKYSDFIINWTINKLPGKNLGIEDVRDVYTDIYPVNYKLQLNDKPSDMNIISASIDSIEDQNSIIKESSIVRDKLSFSLNVGCITGQTCNFNIGIESACYEKSNIVVKLTLIDKYQVSIRGISVDSKTYDGAPVAPYGNVQVRIPSLDRDVTDLSKEYITYKYYKITDEGDIPLESAPSSAGKYYYDLKLHGEELWVEGETKIEFEIYKSSKTADNKTIDQIYSMLEETYTDPDIIKDIVTEDMFEGLDVSVGSIQDSYEICKNCTLTLNDGLIAILNLENALPERYISFPITIKSDNYNPINLYYTINIVDKKLVKFDGVNVESKSYDGEQLTYTGDLIVTGPDGEDLTDELWDELVIKCIDRDTETIVYDEMPTNAGRYYLQVKVLDSNKEYQGLKQYQVTIKPRFVQVEENDRIVVLSKEFDGNSDLPIDSLKYSIPISNVLDQDIDNIKAYINLHEYVYPHVQEFAEEQDIYLENINTNSETLLSNYNISDAPALVSYIITPKVASVKFAEGIDREYDFENFDVDMNINFDGLVDGYDPLYTYSAKVASVDVADSKKVDYTITLSPPSPVPEGKFSNSNSRTTEGDYTFLEGEEWTLSYSGTTTVNITKANTESFDISQAKQHINEFGQFVFNFDKSIFPGGLIGEDNVFSVAGIEDPNNIISNWDVNKDTGEITYEISKQYDIDTQAVLNINVTSKNYLDATAKLFVSLSVNNNPNPDAPVSPEIFTASQTSDNMQLMILLIFAAFIIASLSFRKYLLKK